MRHITATTGDRLAQASPQELVGKRTINRRKRVEPGEGHYRPGGAGTRTRVSKLLVLIIPASSLLGTGDEFNQVLEMTSQLQAHMSNGTIVALGVERGEFRLKVTLGNLAEESDDKLLSDFFRELERFYDVNDLLREGFTSGVPRYEYTIGDFVADEGSFA